MAAVSRMTRQLSDERATILAKEAVDLSKSGDGEKASRKLREAAALGHDNVDVQAAFLSLHKDQSGSPLLGHCRRYALYHDEKAGVDAISFLRGHGSTIAGSDAIECLQIVLETKPASLSNSQDTIFAELARHNNEVRLYVASQMRLSTTEFFDNVYDRGDQAANCLRTIALDVSLWASEEVRLRVEEDLFQLFLAKLMESGHDLDGRALRGIALLLMADTQRLQAFVDEESFDAILSSLHIQLPPDVRGQATIILSKLLEAAEEPGRKYFTAFVTLHVSKQKNDDLILAFSAAASLFPLAPTITAPLFLTEGFLPSLMPLLSRKTSSANVHDAFLALLNAACIDEACRTAVSNYCAPWLSDRVSNGSMRQSAVAATVLAKLRASDPQQKQNTSAADNDGDVHELVDLFKMNLGAEEPNSLPESLEGLAYSSLRSEVKEDLAQDKHFLVSLVQVLNTHANKPDVVIGGLSIISNLTQYRPSLSEEQKKLSQLNAYASASKLPKPSLLENDEHVDLRCTKVVEVGIAPVLCKIGKDGSAAVKQVIAKIFLSLSRNPKDRGKITQQGAVKLLISLHQSGSQASEKETSFSLPLDAAHALARILISLNPSHVFPAGTTPHITSAVGPLVLLLKPDSSPALSDRPRDLLPVFEGLLALTNLASSPDPAAANTIIRTAGDDVEDLLLSNNTLIRRAACELMCNLTGYPSGAARFVDGSRRAGQRLHLLLALADVEDVATRRAAGGALAMLTEHEAAIASILDVQRGADIILGLCHDEEDDIVQRGLVCVKNIIDAGGHIGERGRRALKDAETKRTSTTQSVI